MSIVDQFVAWVNSITVDEPDRVIDHRSWDSCVVGVFADHNGYGAWEVHESFKRHYGKSAWMILGNGGYGMNGMNIVDISTYKLMAEWLNSLESVG